MQRKANSTPWLGWSWSKSAADQVLKKARKTGQAVTAIVCHAIEAHDSSCCCCCLYVTTNRNNRTCLADRGGRDCCDSCSSKQALRRCNSQTAAAGNADVMSQTSWQDKLDTAVACRQTTSVAVVETTATHRSETVITTDSC
jgi:hypothetical protein